MIFHKFPSRNSHKNEFLLRISSDDRATFQPRVIMSEKIEDAKKREKGVRRETDGNCRVMARPGRSGGSRVEARTDMHGSQICMSMASNINYT